MSDDLRAIVHLDLDAFFAAVEILENPDLAGKPVVVGGHPTGRGVVTSASYPARAFGVRSAMPTFRALKLCPQAIVVPVRHRLYSQYSQQVMDVLRDMTPKVEQMSIDEAFMDLSDHIDAWQEAVDLARSLQERVLSDVGLSASLGVATNKLVAKVASDHDKPGGITVVLPGQEAEFLAPLPVRALWGVGPVTAERLAGIGVTTVGDLANLSQEDMSEMFGRHAQSMRKRALGVDKRSVTTQRRRKSISHENTFRHDVSDKHKLKVRLWKMSQSVAKRLKRRKMAASCVAIKLRYADFETLTRQMRLAVPTDDDIEIYRAALTLLDRNWQEGRPVRLIGVGARQLCTPSPQLSLLPPE